jgi:hypothetical protein
VGDALEVTNGEVCAGYIRVNRSGLIWINCVSKEQRKIAVGLKIIWKPEVLCLELRSRAPVKGVMSRQV